MIKFPDQNQFPIITTNRLKLRQFKTADIELLYQFNTDLEMLRYIPRDLYTRKKEARDRYREFQEFYRQQTAIWWVIEDKTQNITAGYCGLFGMEHLPRSAVIGYGILKPLWGRGIATETIAALVKYGSHTLNLHRIQAFVAPGNPGSSKALEKNGFQLEGHLKDIDFARDQYFDRLVYAFIAA